MPIPFIKAHGAANDFLITWANEAPAETALVAQAVAICDRHTGIGADGWLLLQPPSAAGEPARLRLFNPDGSEVEMSGNGTRCAAAVLIDAGHAPSGRVDILTGGGLKHLTLLDRRGCHFDFEMNMSRPQWRADEIHTRLALREAEVDATLLWVGNPQCAVFPAAGESFPGNWRALGAEIERHSRFPNRTNVSFIVPRDAHSIDVRFFERGAGETMSSGTGSTGAAVAAILRGLVSSPVRVLTPAGPLEFRWDSPEADAFLHGPAEIVGSGVSY
jgi:diaminopimelate epimerase